MKNKSLKFFDKIVMALLGVFPFYSGCDEPRMMYGTPTADHLFKGTVTDDLKNTPIKDIRMVIWNSQDSLHRLADTVYTDSNGKYAFTFSSFPDENVIYEIKAEDMDGTANGGAFESKAIATTLAEATWDRSDAGDWYTGKATIIKDFKLRK
jgi:putative lipoprotein (rSAM/lipoprotein system)